MTDLANRLRALRDDMRHNAAEVATLDEALTVLAEAGEPACFVVVELREGMPWIEDGPFSREEAVELAAQHTEQMAGLTGGQYRAAAVHLIADHTNGSTT